MSTATPLLTPEDLLSRSDRKNYELVDGQLVELRTSVRSSWIAGQVYFQIATFVEKVPLGWVYPEGTGFQCFPDEPLKVRKPDTSFVSLARQPNGPDDPGFIRVAPELAVEVISQHDLVWELDVKVNDWLEAGVLVVWVVSPQTRSVMVFRQDRDPQRVTDQQELTLEGVLPEFRCRVSDFLP